MHYIFLKNIIDTTIENFHCQSCGNNITAESVQVTGLNDHGIIMEIVCAHCNSHTEVKAEVHAMAHEMLKSVEGRTFFNTMLQKGAVMDAGQVSRSDTIRDEDIKKIEQDISSATSFEDLLT